MLVVGYFATIMATVSTLIGCDAPNFSRPEGIIDVQIRNFRWSDLDTFVELAAQVQRGWWAASSPERMREWLGQPNLHPEKELFLAYQGARPVGYVQNTFEPPLKRLIIEGGVHPDYLGLGVDARLLEASLVLAEERGYKVVHISLPCGGLAARRLARSMGFGIARRHWEMRLRDPAQVPPPRIPSGFTLRSFVDGDEKALRDIQNLAFSRHWGFSPNTVEEVGYRTRMSLCRPEDILFVTLEDKVAGFCWTRMEEGSRDVTGFISMMGTHPEFRGRGLGEAVMKAGVSYLRDTGVARVNLTVDSQNPSAIKIYYAGGFRRRAVTLWYERRL